MKFIFKLLALNVIFAICMTFFSYDNVYAGKDKPTAVQGKSSKDYSNDSFYTEYVSQISCSSLLKIYRLIKSENPYFHAKRKVCRDVKELRSFFCDNQHICKDFVISYVMEHPECKKVFEKNVLKQNFQDEYTADKSYKADPFFQDYVHNLKLKDLRYIVSVDRILSNLFKSSFDMNLDFALSCPRVMRKFIVENKQISEPVVITYVQKNPEILCKKKKKAPIVSFKEGKKESNTVLPAPINYVPVQGLQSAPADSSFLNSPINNTGFTLLQTPAAIELFLKKTVTPAPNNLPLFPTIQYDQESTENLSFMDLLESFKLAKKGY